MLDIGWTELLLVGVLALIVLGPRDLTRLAFMMGHWVGQARTAMGDLRRAFEDMAEELESDQKAGGDSTNKIAPENAPENALEHAPPLTKEPQKKAKPKNAKNKKSKKSQKIKKSSKKRQSK